MNVSIVVLMPCTSKIMIVIFRLVYKNRFLVLNILIEKYGKKKWLLFFYVCLVVEVSIELVNESITRIDVARAGSPTNISAPLVKPSS